MNECPKESDTRSHIIRKLDIKSRGMKYFTLLFIFVLCHGATYAQRFVPVLLEGNDLMDQQALATGDIYDLHVFNNELVCGGKFTEFFGLDIANLATWDGENANAFEPLPSFISSDRIASMITYNGDLIIAGRLTNYSGAAMLVDSTWTSIGVAGGNFHSEIIEYNSTLYTYRDSIIYKRVDDQWLAMDQLFSTSIMDVEVFENKMYVAADSTLYSFDGNVWLDYNYNTDGRTNLLSVVDNELYISVQFNADVNGNFPFSIYRLIAEQLAPANISVPIDQQYAGKVYSIFEKNIVTKSYNPIGPFRCPNGHYVEGNFATSRHNFGPSDIVFFEGEYYACICSTSFFAGGLHLVKAGTDYIQLSSGSLKPLINPLASQFYDSSSRASFYFPTDEHDEISTLYSAALWLYGINDSDTIVSANTYNNLQNFTFGPIANEQNQGYLNKYLRVFDLTKAQINFHITNYTNPNYEMPEVIANWPAHGNTVNGEAINLAPFVDLNSNGLYEPELGDYPAIKGDQCAYFMLNDKNSYAQLFEVDELLPDSLNVEIHVMAYLYESPLEEVSHTLFMNYRIINRSENDYEKFRAAVWTDFDNGSPFDDYVGCDSLLKFYYSFNGDADDQMSSVSYGYCNYPASAGCLFLNQKMTNSVYYNIGTNPASGDPIIDEHFYNFMNSTWKNGQHILWGGNGVSGVGVTNQEANYMFPSYPWQTEGNIWNEQSSGNPSGDRRMMGSGEEIFLGKGEEFCFDIAYVMARDTNAVAEPQLASLQLLQSYIPVVQQFYNDQHFDCYKSTIEPTGDNGTSGDDWFQVYPNPGGDMIAVAVPYDGLEYRLVIYDAIGQLVKDLVITGDKPFQTIDTRGMANAMYMIALIKNDKLLTRKWLKISE